MTSVEWGKSPPAEVSCGVPFWPMPVVFQRVPVPVRLRGQVTQVDVAERLGTKQSHVSRMERTSNPSLATVERYAARNNRVHRSRGQHMVAQDTEIFKPVRRHTAN